MAFAAIFRFYHIGLIPQGLIHWDEGLIYDISRAIVAGKREIFNMEGNDGQIPYWANAACLHLLATALQALGCPPALCGLASVGLVILLGKELGGPRLGLIAGALMGTAYWPVAFSRAEYPVSSSYVPVLGCLWLLLRDCAGPAR